MSKKTRIDKKLELKLLLRARRLLARSQTQKEARKKERAINRIKMRTLRIRTPKPARKDRAEIVARQNKFRAPYGSEG